MQSVRNAVRKGFTLVEILIVVVILGILAAIVVPQFTNAANDARAGNVATQESTIETQLELWAARNNGVYPDLVTAGQKWSDLVTAGYFKSPPKNPYSKNATDAVKVTATTMADEDAADTAASAAANTVDKGWLYDKATGLIRAARGGV
jgi:general secretion pathway protein G